MSGFFILFSYSLDKERGIAKSFKTRTVRLFFACVSTYEFFILYKDKKAFVRLKPFILVCGKVRYLLLECHLRTFKAMIDLS